VVGHRLHARREARHRLLLFRKRWLGLIGHGVNFLPVASCGNGGQRRRVPNLHLMLTWKRSSDANQRDQRQQEEPMTRPMKRPRQLDEGAKEIPG